MSDRGGRGRGRDRGGGRGGRGQYSNHHGSHDDYDMDGRGQHSYDHDYRKRDDDWRGDYRRGDVRDAGGGAARREPLPNPPHSASRSEFSVPPPRPPPKAPSRERSRESISRGGGGVGGGGGDRGAGPAVGGAGGGPPSVPAAIHTKGIGAAGSLVSVQSPRERGMINDSKAPIAPGQLGPRRPGSLSIPPSRDLFDADQQAQYSPSRRKDSISEPSPRGAGGLARPPSSSKAHASPHLGGSEMSPISAAGSSSKMVRSSSHTLRPDSPSTMATDQPISDIFIDAGNAYHRYSQSKAALEVAKNDVRRYQQFFGGFPAIRDRYNSAQSTAEKAYEKDRQYYKESSMKLNLFLQKIVENTLLKKESNQEIEEIRRVADEAAKASKDALKIAGSAGGAGLDERIASVSQALIEKRQPAEAEPLTKLKEEVVGLREANTTMKSEFQQYKLENERQLKDYQAKLDRLLESQKGLDQEMVRLRTLGNTNKENVNKALKASIESKKETERAGLENKNAQDSSLHEMQAKIEKLENELSNVKNNPPVQPIPTPQPPPPPPSPPWYPTDFREQWDNVQTNITNLHEKMAKCDVAVEMAYQTMNEAQDIISGELENTQKTVTQLSTERQADSTKLDECLKELAELDIVVRDVSTRQAATAAATVAAATAPPAPSAPQNTAGGAGLSQQQILEIQSRLQFYHENVLKPLDHRVQDLEHRYSHIHTSALPILDKRTSDHKILLDQFTAAITSQHERLLKVESLGEALSISVQNVNDAFTNFQPKDIADKVWYHMLTTNPNVQRTLELAKEMVTLKISLDNMAKIVGGAPQGPSGQQQINGAQQQPQQISAPTQPPQPPQQPQQQTPQAAPPQQQQQQQQQQNGIAVLPQGIASLPLRVTALESSITPLPPRITTIESQLNALPQRLSTLESNINSIPPRVITLESSTSTLDTKLASLNTTIETLTTNLTSLQTELASLTESYTAHTKEYAQGRLDHLEAEFETKVETNLKEWAKRVGERITKLTRQMKVIESELWQGEEGDEGEDRSMEGSRQGSLEGGVGGGGGGERENGDGDGGGGQGDEEQQARMRQEQALQQQVQSQAAHHQQQQRQQQDRWRVVGNVSSGRGRQQQGDASAGGGS